jgi:hypothetical protein
LAIASCGSDEASAIAIAMADARLTHPHIVCQQATAAYTLAVRHLILNPKDQKGALASVRCYLEATQSEVFEWFEDAMAGELPEGKPNMGFVKIGFTNSDNPNRPSPVLITNHQAKEKSANDSYRYLLQPNLLGR